MTDASDLFPKWQAALHAIDEDKPETEHTFAVRCYEMENAEIRTIADADAIIEAAEHGVQIDVHTLRKVRGLIGRQQEILRNFANNLAECMEPFEAVSIPVMPITSTNHELAEALRPSSEQMRKILEGVQASIRKSLRNLQVH